MVAKLLLGNFEDFGRLRVAKLGFDALDPNLTNEQLVFDSAWSEILNIHQMSRDTGALPLVQRNYGGDGGGWFRFTADVSFPTLPFEPIALGWMRDDNIASTDKSNDSSGTPFGLGSGIDYAQRYIPVTPVVGTNFVRLTACRASNVPTRFAYYVFNKPLMGPDPREAASGGSNKVVLGNHPTRGSGLWISRRGADALTCGDDDMTLSTDRPVLQVKESGTFSGVMAPYAGINCIRGNFTTTKSYPNRPPVIIRAANDAWGAPLNKQITNSEWGWINDNTIHYVLFGGTSSDTIAWTILDYDDAYVPGPDAVSTIRIAMHPDFGLHVSKKNINAFTTDEDGLLLRTDRSVLHVSARPSVTSIGSNAGAVSSGTNIAGVPIAFFGFTWNGETYCRPNAMKVNPIQVDWRRTAGGFGTDLGAARVAAGNQVHYHFLPGSAGASWSAAVIEHS